MQKWPVVNEKNIKQSQECTVYVWTTLDDKCKIVKKTISDQRNMVGPATWLDGTSNKQKQRKSILHQAFYQTIWIYYASINTSKSVFCNVHWCRVANVYGAHFFSVSFLVFISKIRIHQPRNLIISGNLFNFASSRNLYEIHPKKLLQLLLLRERERQDDAVTAGEDDGAFVPGATKLCAATGLLKMMHV